MSLSRKSAARRLGRRVHFDGNLTLPRERKREYIVYLSVEVGGGIFPYVWLRDNPSMTEIREVITLDGLKFNLT